jgi:hypothetical protein
MLFVALGKVRSGTTRERVARRVNWQYPDGLKMVAEYWLQTTDPNIISIAEADSIAPVMAATAAWDDVLDWTVVPAIAAEEGIQLAKQMMQG